MTDSKYYRFVNAENSEDYDNYIEKCKKLALYETGALADTEINLSPYLPVNIPIIMADSL